MKGSYFRTPRTLAECQFQTGYRPALPRDVWAEAGHLILGAVSAVGLLAAVGLAFLGAI